MDSRWSSWSQSRSSSLDLWLRPLFGYLLNLACEMDYLALLLTSFLFGGMLLFSVGFGTLSFKFFEAPIARAFIRKTFPYFYGYVLVISALIFLVCFNISNLTSALAFSIFITTIPTSRVLMPAINNASDAKQKRNFVLLHTVSVLITLLHIVISAILLYLIFTV